MKRILFCCMLVFVASPVSFAAELEGQDGRDRTDLILDILPGSILISSDIDNFSVTRQVTLPDGSTTFSREEPSLVTTVPTIRAGFGFDLEPVYVDATLGIGLMLNSRFQSVMYRGDVGAHFSFARNGSMGPHIGVVQFSGLDWHGDADVDLDSSTGIVYGLHVKIGYDIAFMMSLDYLDADASVDGVDGWVPSDNTLDFSGLMLSFGVRGRF